MLCPLSVVGVRSVKPLGSVTKTSSSISNITLKASGQLNLASEKRLKNRNVHSNLV